MVIDQQEAAAALASMREAKGRMTKGPRWGWRYHFLFGGVMAALFVTQVVPLPWRFLALLACMIGVFLIKKWGRDSSGRFINGFRKGRTRLVAVGLLAFLMPFYLWCSWLAFSHGVPLAPLYGGIVIFPIAVFADWLWVKAYDADLAEGK